MMRVLTAEDEVRLAKRIERGDLTAKGRMIESNLRLVHAVAQRYRDRGVPYDDLVQEGAVALVRAVEKFDHRRALKFSTYAAWWIRRAMLEALREARMIQMPVCAQRDIALIGRAEDELRRLGAPTGSHEEIARRTGLQLRTVRRLRAAPHVAASLDEVVGDDGIPFGELVPDERAAPIWQRAEDCETRRELRSMLALLPARHRHVLMRRHGLGQTHKQIAASLGVGEERSRQLERQALHWLRELAQPSLQS